MYTSKLFCQFEYFFLALCHIGIAMRNLFLNNLNLMTPKLFGMLNCNHMDIDRLNFF
jgi:hypothetical protein